MSRIEFESNGTTYTLEFDRRSAEVAERTMGLSLSDLLNGKLTLFPSLFQAAFLKHHPKIKPSVVQAFFESMEDKQELFQALVGMYAECVTTLVDEPEEGKGNSWKRV